MLLLIIDSDAARAETVAASLRLNGAAVHMDRHESVGHLPDNTRQYDLCLISLENRKTLKDIGVEQLREMEQDCPVLALGQASADCSLGSILAHGFADWVDVDDLLHLREVARREGERLASSRHTALLRDALLDSERRAERVMQDTREPLAIIVDGAHASTNKSYRKLLGLSSHDEAVATPFLDLVARPERDTAKELLRAYAREGCSTQQTRLSLLRCDDLLLDATLHVSPYLGDGERGLLLAVRSLAQLPPPEKKPPKKLASSPDKSKIEDKTGAAIDKAMRQNALKVGFQELQGASGSPSEHVLVEISPRHKTLDLPANTQLLRLAANLKTNQSLDRWLLFTAAREAQRKDMRGNFLHIPISARSLHDSTIINWLRQLLGQVASTELQLVLSLHIEDCHAHLEASRVFFKEARDLGCKTSFSSAFKESADLDIIRDFQPDFVQLHEGVLRSVGKQDFSPENLSRLTALIAASGAKTICPPNESGLPTEDLVRMGVNYCVANTETANS